jgi:hypothetical protein
LLTPIAAMESVSVRADEKLTAFEEMEMERAIHEFAVSLIS